MIIRDAQLPMLTGVAITATNWGINYRLDYMIQPLITKMKNIQLYCIPLLICLGCSSDNESRTQSELKVQQVNNKITLKSNIKRDAAVKEIFLSYMDEFGAGIDLYGNLSIKDLSATIVSDVPVFIKDVSPSSSEYVLLKGDEITIGLKQKEDRVLLFKTNDSVRNNELNFLVALKEGSKDFPSTKMIRDSIKVPDFKFQDQRVKDIFMLLKRMSGLSKKSALFGYDYYTTLFNDNLSFLNNYEKGHPIRPALATLFKQYISYDYYTKIIILTLSKSKNGETIPPVLNDKMQELSSTFNEDKLSYMPAYRSAAFAYAQYLSFLKNGKVDNVHSLFETIDSDFKGKTKEYLLFKVVDTYVSLTNKVDTGFLNKYYAAETYKPYIAEIKARNEANAEISIAATELEDISGKKINLKQLIAENKDKVLYIDFWASWCLPCVREMPYSEKLKEVFKMKAIRFVYFSFDEKKSDWLNSNAVNHDSNSFLVKGNFKSLLAKQLKVKSIPRYIIINKKGEIINSNAKRPSDPDLVTELNRLIL